MPGCEQCSVALDEEQEDVQHRDEVCAVGVQKRPERKLIVGMTLEVPGAAEAEVRDADASPRNERGCA